MTYTLSAKEREIADTLCNEDPLKGLPVPEDVLYWVAKLASLVEDDDPRFDALSKVLRYCLLCEAWTTMLSGSVFPHYAARENAGAWGPEDIREWERWQHSYQHHIIDAKRSAYQAATIVASIKGVCIDPDALVPNGARTARSTVEVLKAAYNVLTTGIQAPGL